MSDWAAVVDAFRRDGVVHLPNFLSPAEIDRLERSFDRYLAEVVPTLPPADAFYETQGDRRALKQLQRVETHDAELAEVCGDAKYVHLAERLLGGPVRSMGLEWFNKPAEIGKATPPHQDGYYFCLEPDQALTLWIALEDIDEENGCLRYVKGSHRQPHREHGRSEVLGFSQTILDFGPTDFEQQYVAVLKRGDALAHHSGTIHWAEANRSPRSRRSAALVYFLATAQRDAAKWQRYQQSSHAHQRALGAI